MDREQLLANARRILDEEGVESLMEDGPDLIAALVDDLSRADAERDVAIAAAISHEREACANTCERMVIGGRARTEAQAFAARVLFDAAAEIRARGGV